VDASADYFDRTAARKSAPASRPSSPAAAPPGPTPRGDEGGTWYVQVGVFRDRASVEGQVARLSESGWPVRIVTDDRDGDVLYKIQVGGYASETRAREKQSELEGAGFRGAYVTSGG
jgi:cell division protein FtsN